jgi:hypothetical protein
MIILNNRSGVSGPDSLNADQTSKGFAEFGSKTSFFLFPRPRISPLKTFPDFKIRNFLLHLFELRFVQCCGSGSGMGQKPDPDPGSGMNMPDNFSKSLETV